jgi:hypothetical protein
LVIFCRDHLDKLGLTILEGPEVPAAAVTFTVPVPARGCEGVTDPEAKSVSAVTSVLV